MTSSSSGPSRRATVRDVSRLSGVSVGTVSNVINSPDIVAEETRRKVQAAIDELGFRPQAAARSLGSRRSFMIGYPVYRSGWASVMGEFFRELVEGAAGHGLGVAAVATGTADPVEGFEHLLDVGAVDAFLLSEVTENDPRVRWLLDRGVPFAAFGRAEIDEPYSWVDLDIHAGMRHLTEHVLEQGHRELAYVGWDGQPTNRFRREGIEQALAGLGVDLRPDRVLETAFSVDGGEEAAVTLLAAPAPPTAILCGHDVIAAGVLRAAHARGIPVGQEGLLVTGFDDTPVALATTPALTSVAFPLGAVARHLVRLLVQRLEDPGATPETVLVEPQVVVRGSSTRGA